MSNASGGPVFSPLDAGHAIVIDVCSGIKKFFF